MHLHQVTQLLHAKLQQPLPGDAVRLTMAPSVRIPTGKWKPHNIENAMQAGVLIMLYPHMDTVFTALMQRPHDGYAHSGQISFPGGRLEDTDANLTATALRETREEFGIDDTQVQPLGTLSRLYIPASNFWVLPTVGYLTHRPTFNPQVQEVAAIIETPLTYLLQDDIVKRKTFTNPAGITIDAPYYDVNGHVVWGATAMILSEFLFLLK